MFRCQVSKREAAAQVFSLCPFFLCRSVVRFIVYGYIISQAGQAVKPFFEKNCLANNFFYCQILTGKNWGGLPGKW